MPGAAAATGTRGWPLKNAHLECCLIFCVFSFGENRKVGILVAWERVVKREQKTLPWEELNLHTDSV